MEFDFENYKAVLLLECKDVFPQLLADVEAEGEQIYGIYLYYSCAGWGYLFPSVFTLEGLETVTKHYKEELNYDEPKEEVRASLKWSPCDSPWHTKYDDPLQQTSSLLRKFEDYLEERAQLDDETERNPAIMIDHYGEAIDTIRYATLSVLKTLRDAGVFGDPKKAPLVTLMSGDQSFEEILENAEIINPTEIFQTYKTDWG